jgi:hypothetical protein
MFVTEATALLAHPLPAVAAVLGRVAALPRWCVGVRRARLASGALQPCRADGCGLLYLTPDVRLVLVARTVEHTLPGGPMVHEATGDGVALTWAFTLAPEASPAGAGAAVATRLRARITLEVDAAHATGAYRATLCRLIARRVPDDLLRLAALLERGAAAPALEAGPLTLG